MRWVSDFHGVTAEAISSSAQDTFPTYQTFASL